jgi:hypothetical protein
VIIYPCRSDLFGHLSPQLEDSLGVFPWGFQDIRIAIAPSKIGMTEDGDKGESSNQARGNPGLAGLGQAHRRSLGYAPPDFLLRLVALVNLMRLSLKRKAHTQPCPA